MCPTVNKGVLEEVLLVPALLLAVLLVADVAAVDDADTVARESDEALAPRARSEAEAEDTAEEAVEMAAVDEGNRLADRLPRSSLSAVMPADMRELNSCSVEMVVVWPAVEETSDPSRGLS